VHVDSHQKSTVPKIMSTPSLEEKIWDGAVKIVDQNPTLSRRARAAYKATKSTYLQAAALGRHLTGGGTKPTNIYHASIQRTGSRWIKSVFSDHRIQKYSGLWTFPQHRYEVTKFHSTFPKYTFVPGLYVNYEQYRNIKKPDIHRTFYIIRDPRDATLSWYKSMLKTHKLVNESVKIYRSKFSKMSREDGIKEAIKLFSVKISYMKDWKLNSVNDDSVKIFKFENLISKPKMGLKKIFDHCGIDIPAPVIEEVVDDYTKEDMRYRDKKRRNENNTDYTSESTKWRDSFTKNHLELFKYINGPVSKILGYN